VSSAYTIRSACLNSKSQDPVQFSSSTEARTSSQFKDEAIDAAGLYLHIFLRCVSRNRNVP
jgi:hypothetical protein